jgi:hypothetical protein
MELRPEMSVSVPAGPATIKIDNDEPKPIWKRIELQPHTVPTADLKELIKVRGHFWNRSHLYTTTSGGAVWVNKLFRVRGTKDIRPYSEQHPIWTKGQVGARRWAPVFSIFGAGYQTYANVQAVSN